jgi:hypothetical protein
MTVTFGSPRSFKNIVSARFPRGWTNSSTLRTSMRGAASGRCDHSEWLQCDSLHPSKKRECARSHAALRALKKSILRQIDTTSASISGAPGQQPAKGWILLLRLSRDDELSSTDDAIFCQQYSLNASIKAATQPHYWRCCVKLEFFPRHGQHGLEWPHASRTCNLRALLLARVDHCPYSLKWKACLQRFGLETSLDCPPGTK